MRIGIKVAGYRVTLTWIRYVEVKGVNSFVKSIGKHFLMWDFDDSSSIEVIKFLTDVSLKWSLPDIHILNTGKPNHYHAYCFRASTWGETLHILADTKGLCGTYLKLGVLRGYYTLRFTPKGKETFEYLGMITGTSEYEGISPTIINNFVHYETKRG